MDTEHELPASLVKRASVRGKEYAWRLEDIPAVIEAARTAGLVSLGGQLQFRLPDGGTCECYWIEVDTLREDNKAATWKARVQLTAEVAQRQFSKLPSKDALVAEGRKAFAPYLAEAEEAGQSPHDLMWFVWYLENRP